MTIGTGSNQTAAVPSPVSSFVWALAWLVVTAIAVGFAMAIGPALFALEPRGKGSGLALIMPVLAAVVVILILVRGIRRSGPWSGYAASTTPAQRRADADARLARDPSAAVLGIGVVALGVWVALGILFFVLLSSGAPSATGLLGALLVLSVVAIIWTGCLWLGLRRRAAQRRMSSSN